MAVFIRVVEGRIDQGFLEILNIVTNTNFISSGEIYMYIEFHLGSIVIHSGEIVVLAMVLVFQIR